MRFLFSLYLNCMKHSERAINQNQIDLQCSRTSSESNALRLNEFECKSQTIILNIFDDYFHKFNWFLSSEYNADWKTWRGKIHLYNIFLY